MTWFSRRKVGRRREKTAASSPTLALPKGEPGFRKQERERIERTALIASVHDAVWARDNGGCRVGGCTWHPDDEMHEIRSRAQLRGRPDAEVFNTANCIRLCREHHRDVTEHRLTVGCLTDRGADGDVVFYRVGVDIAGASADYTVIDDPSADYTDEPRAPMPLPITAEEFQRAARAIIESIEAAENERLVRGLPATEGSFMNDDELRRAFLDAVRAGNTSEAVALENELYRRRGQPRQTPAPRQAAVNSSTRMDASRLTMSGMITSEMRTATAIVNGFGSNFATTGSGGVSQPRQYRNDGGIVLRDAKGFELSRMLPFGHTRNPPNTIEIAVGGGIVTEPTGPPAFEKVPTVTFENTGEYDINGRLVYRERVSKKPATVEQPKGRAITVEK